MITSNKERLKMHSKITLGKIDHICEIVNDIEATVKRIYENFETPPFQIEEYSSTARMNGKEVGKYKLKMAFIKISDNMTLELLQITEGKSVEQDWLKMHGETIHHVAIKVKDIEKEAAKWEKKGIQTLQEDGGKWIYLNTEAILGTNIELIPE
jgi:methylmalonyl-CoA/ethylmalonyl-CoA epimerase